MIRHSTGTKRTKGKVSCYFHNKSTDGWKYLKYHSIIFLVDGERWSFDPNHNGDVETGYVMEHLFVDLTEERLLKLAKATNAEVKVGSDSFVFGNMMLDAIKDFASLIANPDAPIPDRILEMDTARRASMPDQSYDAFLKAYKEKLKTPAAPEIRASGKLGIAKGHEKDGRTKLAISAYRELIKDFPGTPQAAEAAKRLKNLGAK